jgi:hypothetical protein
MSQYTLSKQFLSPHHPIRAMEISPDMKFLCIGGGSSLYILDSVFGSALALIEFDITPVVVRWYMTAPHLIFAGFNDGTFTTVKMMVTPDLKITTGSSYGDGHTAPVSAIAMDGTNSVLAVATGQIIHLYRFEPSGGSAPFLSSPDFILTPCTAEFSHIQDLIVPLQGGQIVPTVISLVFSEAEALYASTLTDGVV